MEAEGKASFKTVSTREIDILLAFLRSGDGHLLSSRPVGTTEVGVGAVAIKVERAGYFLLKLLPETGFCHGLYL